MRSRYRSMKALFVLTLFLVTTLLPLPAHGQTGRGDADTHETPALDLIVLVDESETMWNKTDTEGVRVNTVNFLIDLLASERSGPTHRVAIIAFGTEPGVIPFTTLDSATSAEVLKQQFQTVHDSIDDHHDLEYTDINKALNAALKLLADEGDPARKPALVLISDGQPTSPQVSEKIGEASVAAYLDETRNLLSQLEQYSYRGALCSTPQGAPLYTVGMGVDKLIVASSPEFITLYREFWQGNSGSTGGYYQEAERLQDMQGVTTYIFSELLCTPATPSESIRPEQVLEYQIYDSYYQIFFTISGKDNPDLTAKIYRPTQNGTTSDVPLEKDDEGVTWQGGPDYEVWGITYNEPWSGIWRVQLEGEGRAEFNYVFFPNVTIELVEPNGGFLPVDRPLKIQARVRDENGQVVDVPLENFQVEIEGQGFRKQLALQKEGGAYGVEHEPLPETGEYSLTLSAQLPNGTPIFDHKFITLVSAPWVEVTEPPEDATFTPDKTIPLEAKLHPEGAISFDDIKVIARLMKDGEPVQTVELSRGETVTEGDEDVVLFDGEIPPVEEDGDYTLQTELIAILPGGRVFDHETAPLPFSITAPATPTPNPTPTPEPSPTPLPTATVEPTATPAPAAAVVESPTPSPVPPTATPAPPLSLGSIIGTSPVFPCLLGLLLFLLLLALVWALRRRRGRNVPDQIKLLAGLMRTRQESGEPPYVLILGSGTAVALGNRSMKEVVEAVTGGNNDLESFHKALDGFSPIERQVILKKQFEEANGSPGYRHLAELAKRGYFDIIFTTNVDSFLEGALTNGKADTAEFEVFIPGLKQGAETIEHLKSPIPPIKIVKLHGDVEARSFAFTPSEISNFGSASEEVLRQYLNRDLIIVGPGSRDYDLNRAIEREGGSIWFVGDNPPNAETPLHQALSTRSSTMNIISGEYGLFDPFFEALHRELARS